VVSTDSNEVSTTALSSSTVDGRSRLTSDSKVTVSEELADEGVLRLGHAGLEIVLERILVLIDPALGIVSDTSSIVDNLEGGLGETRLAVLGVSLAKLVVALLEEALVTRLSVARFIKESEDSRGLAGLDQVNGGLRVHTKIDEGPVDLLTDVFLLFEFEHVIVKELLELLVGVVNAQLLEGVELEDFESSDIKNSDEGSAASTSNHLVNFLDNPQEQTTVEGLGKGLPRVVGLCDVHGSLHHGTTSLNAGLAKTSLEGSGIDLKNLRSKLSVGGILHRRRFTTASGEIDVTEVGDTSASSVDILNVFLAESHDSHGLLR
jgi:hypothetical protein